MQWTPVLLSEALLAHGVYVCLEGLTEPGADKLQETPKRPHGILQGSGVRGIGKHASPSKPLASSSVNLPGCEPYAREAMRHAHPWHPYRPSKSAVLERWRTRERRQVTSPDLDGSGVLTCQVENSRPTRERKR